MCNDPYNNFFQLSQISISAETSVPPQPPNPARRFWTMISRHYLPAKESPPLRERHKLKFLARHASSNSPLQPAQTTADEPTLEGKVRAGEDDEESERGDDLSASKLDQGKGKQREESLADAQSPPPNDHTTKLESFEDRNLLKRLLRARGRDPTPVNVAPETKRPPVVEVYAVRGFQRYVAMTPKRRRGSSSQHSTPLNMGTNSHRRLVTAGSILPSYSCTGLCIVANLSMAGRAITASYGGTQNSSRWKFIIVHLTIALVAHHAVRDTDSDSVHGSCNKFLDRICFPCGHYHEDS
ncbi:hypothetical protein EDB19DRAFT_1725296 [Suillus lakei]|nr:hypothetical protein EDB19DRAFT_1725296 [Suillus lakei]